MNQLGRRTGNANAPNDWAESHQSCPKGNTDIYIYYTTVIQKTSEQCISDNPAESLKVMT